ncbi:MAG: DUF1192 family protein [Alphaproteobacteria bacterium]|nr:DUF1192 family protein [Alphaproteobacteria bacterium]
MFDEEFKPRKKPGFEKRNLVDMSVFEIKEYIGELKEEIQRAEGDIAKKEASAAAAASIFKS